MNNLPFEILQLVFADTYRHTTAFDASQWTLQRARMGAVCHLWRDVLHSLPWLWRHLRIPIDATYEVTSRLIEKASTFSGASEMSWWLVRARDVEISMDDAQLLQCSQQLDLIAHRCSQLFIGEGITLHQLASILPTEPLITAEMIRFSRVSSRVRCQQVGMSPRPRLSVPRLKRLWVSTPSAATDLLPLDLAATAMHLTVLPSTSPRDILELGAQCLEELIVVYSQATHFRFLPGPPIIMRHLESLTLTVVADFEFQPLLRHLQFPVMDTLSIAFRCGESGVIVNPGSVDLAGIVDEHGVSPFPVLQTLIVGAKSIPRGLFTFASCHHRLTKLAMFNLTLSNARAVILPLLIGEVVPSVSMLIFENCHIREDDEELVRLAATRHALRPGRPFKVVCIED
jgi:hypothetical protein